MPLDASDPSSPRHNRSDRCQPRLRSVALDALAVDDRGGGAMLLFPPVLGLAEQSEVKSIQRALLSRSSKSSSIVLRGGKSFDQARHRRPFGKQVKRWRSQPHGYSPRDAGPAASPAGSAVRITAHSSSFISLGYRSPFLSPSLPLSSVHPTAPSAIARSENRKQFRSTKLFSARPLSVCNVSGLYNVKINSY